MREVADKLIFAEPGFTNTRDKNDKQLPIIHGPGKEEVIQEANQLWADDFVIGWSGKSWVAVKDIKEGVDT